MNEYNVDMKTETEQTDVELHIDAEVIAEVPFPVPMDYSHDRLYDRDLPDQHPIKAIIGLQDRLDEKVNKEAGKSLMTDAERVKLEGIETGAQVNLIEVIKTNGRLIPIENKTVDLDVDFTGTLGFNVGTRTLTLYGEKGEVLSTAVIPGEQSVGDNTTIVIKGDTVSIAPAVMAKLNDHVASKSNPHGVTKAQVGLGSVDNTADKDKPISTKTQAALNLKADQTELDKTNAEVAKKANQSALDATNVTVGTKADDAGVVHKAGYEVITGEKTFNERLNLSGGLIYIQKKGVITGNNGEIFSILGRTEDARSIGKVTMTQKSATESNVSISALGYTDEEVPRQVWASIDLTSRNGKRILLGPPTPEGANGSEIVTAGYLNSAPTVVHTTGNENVAGHKTFMDGWTSKAWNRIQTSVGNISISNKTSDMRIQFKDSADVAYSNITSQIGGKEYSILTIDTRASSSLDKVTSISLTRIGNTHKVTCTPTNDNPDDAEIVTAGWANGKYVGLTGSQTVYGTKQFGNNPYIGGHADPVLYLTATASPIEFSKWNRHGRICFTGDLEVNGVEKKISVGEIIQNQDQYRSAMDMSVFRVNEKGERAVYSSIGPRIGTVDSVPYATASYRTSGQGNADIVTFGMVPTLTDIVHTTGNQTIAGGKTFTDNPVVQNDGIPKISFKTMGYADGDTGGANALAGIAVYDKNFKRYGQLSFVSQDNDRIIGFENFQPGNLANIKKLFFHYQRDGVAYVEAPYRTSGWADSDVVTYGMLKTLGLIKG